MAQFGKVALRIEVYFSLKDVWKGILCVDYSASVSRLEEFCFSGKENSQRATSHSQPICS